MVIQSVGVLTQNHLSSTLILAMEAMNHSNVSVQIQASQFLILKAPRIGIDGAVMTLGQRVVRNVGMPV